MILALTPNAPTLFQRQKIPFDVGACTKSYPSNSSEIVEKRRLRLGHDYMSDTTPPVSYITGVLPSQVLCWRSSENGKGSLSEKLRILIRKIGREFFNYIGDYIYQRTSCQEVVSPHDRQVVNGNCSAYCQLSLSPDNPMFLWYWYSLVLPNKN